MFMSIGPTFLLLLLAGTPAVPANVEPGGEQYLVRIPLAELAGLPPHLRARFDGESVDVTPDGPLAVLLLGAGDLAELQRRVPNAERLSSLSDYLVQFAPRNTLARKPERLAAYAPLAARLAPAMPGEAARGVDPCAEPVLSLQPYDEYHTLAEGECFLNNLAAAFPEITQLVSIGQSIEGRDIWALRVTDNPDTVEPEEQQILFTGVTHAREWVTFEQVLYLAEYLTTRYATDPQVRQVVDNSVIWLVPAVNPDGFVFSWEYQRMWRKNRRQASFGTYGVDLNRNYDFHWGHDDVGSSGMPSAETYRGDAPASEPETQAIQALLTQEQFAIAVSYHSYSQLCLHPWGYTPNVLTQSHTVLTALANKYVKLVHGVHGVRYTPGPAAYTIYQTNGDFTDYAYGRHGVLAFTPELRPASAAEGGFLLPEEQILPTVEENTAAAMWLMLNVANAFEYVRPDGQTLIETPAAGPNHFALSLAPTSQKPAAALGFPMSAAPQWHAWRDDLEYQPPGWAAMDADYEAAAVEGGGSGRGYRLDIYGPELLDWATGLTSYRVLPYVFEDGAEILLSNVQPGLNFLGVPTRAALLLQDIAVEQRILAAGQSYDGKLNYGVKVLDERTAVQDAEAPAPWLDWTWEYVDSAGGVHRSHPTGEAGADPAVQPFRAYHVNVNVPSYKFGSRDEVEPVYVLRLPGFIAFDFPDCNYNATDDAVDIAAGTSLDCNNNGIPDECDLASGFSADCNGNGIPDECDIASGFSEDCAGNGIPDECEPDCNDNGQADSCDIFYGISEDCSGNGIPDECEPDCNDNGQADSCDIFYGTSLDCDLNSVPDECQPGLFAPVTILADGNVSGAFVYALMQAGHTVRVPGRDSPWLNYLPRYNVLVLAINSAGADPAEEQAIDDFVAAGGGLIMFAGYQDQYQGAAYPLSGRAGWTRRTNTSVADPDHPLCFELGETSTLSGFSSVPVPRPGAEVVLTWADGVPFAVTFAHGAGRVVYFNDLWGCYFHNWYGDPEYGNRLMRNALAYVAPELARDCNGNGVHDACDLFTGTSPDENDNGIPDECEIPGDVNCDGLVNAHDIDPFVLALVDPEEYKIAYPGCLLTSADCNGDGLVNTFDIDPFVRLLTGW